MLYSMASEHHTSAGRGFPCLWASCPVGVGVDVDAGHLLLPEVVDESRRSVQESADPLERLPRVQGGMCHPSADFLAGELHVHAVGRQVVAARCRSSEGCGEVAGQLAALLLELVEGGLDARRSGGLRALQAALCNQPLDLPGVALVLDAVRAPTHDSVQDAALLGVVPSWAQARTYV